MSLKCEIKKGTSKLGRVYYYLFLEDLDKVIFLNKTEVKLLSVLYPNLQVPELD